MNAGFRVKPEMTEVLFRKVSVQPIFVTPFIMEGQWPGEALPANSRTVTAPLFRKRRGRGAQDSEKNLAQGAKRVLFKSVSTDADESRPGDIPR